MEFRTYYDMNNIIINNITKLPDDIDAVVGIPRSGIIPATMISLYKNLPLIRIEDLLNENNNIIYGGRTKNKAGWINSINEARNILIVDDSINSGKSINEIKLKLAQKKYKPNFFFLCIYVTPGCELDVDLFFEKVTYPRMFEWNYLNHPLLKNVCFDIDGVLCNDPENWQNDDGNKYISFLNSAFVKLKPSCEIGYIVTSRKEIYREQTENWLKQNGIMYNTLIMQKDNVIKTDESHAEFKADCYSNISDSILFIESNDKQAKIISEISKKAVYCTDSQIFYSSEKKEQKRNRRVYGENVLLRQTKNFLKRMFKKI